MLMLPYPDPGPEHLLIRALYSGVSIGTEFALIRNKIAGQQYPLCTGYQGVGVVEHVGEKVDAFKVGDKVYYRDNREGDAAARWDEGFSRRRRSLLRCCRPPANNARLGTAARRCPQRRCEPVRHARRSA